MDLKAFHGSHLVPDSMFFEAQGKTVNKEYQENDMLSTGE